jgi:hypothetical protein
VTFPKTGPSLRSLEWALGIWLSSGENSCSNLFGKWGSLVSLGKGWRSAGNRSKPQTPCSLYSLPLKWDQPTLYLGYESLGTTWISIMPATDHMPSLATAHPHLGGAVCLCSMTGIGVG